MSTPRISVVIPTFRRPEGLRIACQSVFGQQGIDWSDVEILIVDNDPDASAEEIAAELTSVAPTTVVYVHEPNPGVANARNAAIAQVSGYLIAFLDDDQRAEPDWLSEILGAHEQFGAAVTFGPVIGTLPNMNGPHASYIAAFFSRLGSKESGLMDGFFGCGNSLFDLQQLPFDGNLFDVAANEIGGEDDFLFSRLSEDGHKFGWAAKASVFELVPEKRAKLSYTLKRAFAFGQGPSTLCARQSPPNIPMLLYWSGVGAGQTVVFGSIAAVLWLVRAPNRATWLDRAARGLGKLLWFGPFELKFYGRAAV